MTSKEILPVLMEAADQIRIFHWQTRSYAEHKALGKFYDALSEATDTIAETLIGVEGGRPDLITSFELRNYEVGVSAPYIEAFAKQLEGWKDLPTDILNMRDSLLGDAHHTLYLLSLA